MEKSKSKKGTKRPAEPLSINNEPKESGLDFTNPNSSHQLQVSDLEFVFTNGTLYANAAILLTLSDTFFKGLIVDSWQSMKRNEMNRLVYNMSDPALCGMQHYQSMLPIFHLAYQQSSTMEAIRELFKSLPMLDEFLTFADKIGCNNLVANIHAALRSRIDNYTEIYPILKKHSNFGKLPGLNVPTKDLPCCLEQSFFLDFFRADVINPAGIYSARKLYLNMFEPSTGVEDVQFFWDTCCSQVENIQRLHSLKLLFLFNKAALVATVEKFDLNRWNTSEICTIARQTRTYDTPALMEKLLKHITSSK
jgi:hypothetical protein